MAPPTPPFTRETAIAKIRMAEDAWNSRDPQRVCLAYTEASRWRNRAEFINGRAEIVAFLTRKWNKELDYRLIKELWAFTDNRIAVRFAYEWHDDSGNWFRSYGNENWEFDATGVMLRRFDQRSTDRRSRPEIPLAARAAARRSPGSFRPGALKPDAVRLPRGDEPANASGRARHSAGAADPCRNRCRLESGPRCGCGRVTACHCRRRCRTGDRTLRG
jgi:uncharacterized protein